MKGVKKSCVYLAFALLFTLGACDGESDNPVKEEPSPIELKNFANTGCKDNAVRTRSGEYDWKDIFEYSCIHDGYLYVTHKDAVFNCCPGKLGATVSNEGNCITVIEWSTEDLCDCMCTFDLSYEIGPLVEGGTYSLCIGYGYKGRENQVAEFEFHNSMSGIWEIKGNY
jgi:hypothetical protein